MIIAQLSWRGWVQGLRALLRGEGILRPSPASTVPELRPIARDLGDLIRDLERQYRPLDGSQRIWDQDALRATLRRELHGNDVIVVANREPYMHVRTPDGIHVQRPASGLVTALEPVMRACSGTWIAHGSGSADRDMVDRHDRVAVPPEHPALPGPPDLAVEGGGAGLLLRLRQRGPLAAVPQRPRAARRFAPPTGNTIAASTSDSPTRWRRNRSPADPVVLVQDYHFALLPRMIRERLPDATIITFWHIPWPNPEAFAICPWRTELLAGLLGSSILGFHTQFHCNNFLDTVDRLLEARVDRESFTITFRGQTTAVHRYPISIEWPPAPLAHAPRAVPEARKAVRERLGLPAGHRIGIGIDRLDYTKGIIERFNAVARLLELEPRWVGRFTFVQIAAPSRGAIADYRDYAARVTALARPRSTSASATRELPADHPRSSSTTSPRTSTNTYRAADICFVSSLHDGMNLVAKEFVARARRRAGRARAVAVRRRVARAARGAGRQSV